MKKLKQQRFLAFITFIALIAILAIQVNWLFKAAKFEEITFNHKVNKALIKVREELENSSTSNIEMKNYLCGRPCKVGMREKKIAELDSIIRSNLEIYHIDLDYTFEITATCSEQNTTKLFGTKFYLQSLNGLLEKDGIKIRLAFPNRNQFLLAQIRGTFLLAFFSVIFVMISFVFMSIMFKRESELLQQTSDFINNMVHEFQTPLANIRLAANLIKKKEIANIDNKISEYLSVIINENHKLENNVVEILKVSQNGNDHNLNEDFDLQKLIVQTCNEFQTLIESKNGALNTHFDQKQLLVHGVPEHFRLIVSNLIDNAIKYAKGSPVISIKTFRNEHNVLIQIKDNGIGIDKKYHTKIFEKYYRVSTGDVHNVKGFGLGLTYVKKLIEQNRGKIEVASSKGAGTVFTIILPLNDEKDTNSIG